MKAVEPKLSFISRLRNAEHFEMHEEINEGLKRLEQKLGNIFPLRSAYAALFGKEDMIYKRSAKAIETKYLNQVDKTRRSLYQMIKLRVDSASYSFDADEKDASVKLTEVIENYRNITAGSMVDVSALAYNLIQALRQSRYATAVATLDLGEAVDKMEEFNESFKALYIERAESYNAADNQGNMKYIRPRVDKALHAVIEGVDALYVAAKLSGQTALAADMEEVIDMFNAIIRQYGRIYDRRKNETLYTEIHENS
ncbi:MAG: DUF6261 family protein [Tannerellaceae bacterium]|jgi:hypothetical protein|nr:DUF6261 family protein [Tannerellaceae bacterium]